MPEMPRTIGRFHVVRLLGSGGMADVFLAEDPRLKRQVAIKTIRLTSPDRDQALVRFQREAEISARLSHPNVIVIYDVGEEAGVGPFLAMEYIEGSSFAEHIRAGGVSKEERLRILVHASLGLSAAHAAAIVHRDVKPQNVMVGKDGRVRLMDFGIARSEDHGLTSTGMFIGTPSYIAPEQLAGTEPSESTDRYAFAVMAYQAMVGTVPFSGPSTSVLLYRIAHEPPEIPATVGERMASVFRRALAKDPAERWANLPGFLVALAEASDVGPVEIAGVRRELRLPPASLSGSAAKPGPFEPTARPLPGKAGREPTVAKDPDPPPGTAPSLTRIGALVAAGLVLAVAIWRFTSDWRTVPEVTPARVLEVDSSPPGARFYLDGAPYGETPRRVFVSPDVEHLRVEMTGYEPAERTIPAGAREVMVALEAKPAPPPPIVRVVEPPSKAESAGDVAGSGAEVVERSAPVKPRRSVATRPESTQPRSVREARSERPPDDDPPSESGSFWGKVGGRFKDLGQDIKDASKDLGRRVRGRETAE